MKYNNYFKKLFLKNKKISNKNILDILHELKFKKNFKIFHVGGTNGKGSVSNYLQQGFCNKYKKVGLLTSPHVYKLNERIKINNKIINNELLHKYCQKVLNINKNIPFTTLMYVVSLLYFKDENVGMAIIEVGIGGRYDDSKLIQGEYGVITSVALDHTEILGNSLEKIALDKAGIISFNMVYFISFQMTSKLKNIFINEGKKKNAKIIELNCDLSDYKSYNKSLANGILQYFNINHLKFRDIFGRTTIIKYRNIEHIIDVAHNYSAIKASLSYLKIHDIVYSNICLSLSNDKDINSIKALFSDEIFVYSNSSERSMKLCDYTIGNKIKDLRIFINSLKNVTLFIGSFYFLNDILGVISD